MRLCGCAGSWSKTPIVGFHVEWLIYFLINTTNNVIYLGFATRIAESKFENTIQKKKSMT
jgi:hypothetical protein